MKLVLSLKSLFVYSAIIQIVKEARVVDGRKTGSNVRKFFIAAVEQEWDYAPSGKNQVNGIDLEQDSNAAVFVTRGKTTIGKVYKKVLYREYEDGTFKTPKPHPEHLGVLGPILYGEVGDTIVVQFKNMAGRNYSVHPHGVFYDKGSEGAIYDDKSSEKDKKDDHVVPGGTHTYTWIVSDSHAPTDSDDDCLTWIYHSHVDAVKDINTGLIGPLLTCKKGHLDPSGKRKNIDKEFISLFTVLDENMSWLLDKNIDKFCSEPAKAKAMKENEDFKEANKMHSINGFLYGNAPGLNLCVGDKVRWHLFGIGNEVDLHTAYFHGQSFQVDSHRKDVAPLLPATFVTASMTMTNPGYWMLNCLVNDHYSAGMFAFFNVSRCAGHTASPPVSAGGVTRTYYIAAEEYIWDYGPSGMNNFQVGGGKLNQSGRTEAMETETQTEKKEIFRSFRHRSGRGYAYANLISSDSAVFFTRGNHTIGGRYKKALYFEYTDETFTVKKNKPDFLGFLGPVIRAEIGDIIKVVFKNMATRNYSIMPHGVFFNKSNEGALYHDFTSGKEKLDDVVLPNTTYVYTWSVPDHVGPTSEDAQCITRAYYSSIDPIKDTHSGLMGPLLTCKKGALDKSKGTQLNVDKEFVLLFTVTDESVSWYHEENKKLFCGDPSGVNNDDDGYKESNKMHGINGRLYANLEGLRMCRGDKVSWHLIGLGNEVDMHTAAFYGETVMQDRNRKDTVRLLPGTFTTVYMKPDNIGEWALVCKTTDHYSAGMQAKYKVDKCQSSENEAVGETTRRYFIAAVEEDWDYAPTGKDVVLGKDLKDNENAKVFTVGGDHRIGKIYKKALFREFTDNTFEKTKEREDYLGVLGPTIYAEVGDTIEVVFKNKAKRPYSIHPHGVFYRKSMEGSDYKDGTKGVDTKDNKVAAGSSYTYTWNVPARAGPSLNDTNCLTWSYYSDVDSVKDPNSGLVGAMVVCRKNTLTEENKRKDVDRDFALLFTVMDENKSWYLQDNINKYCKKPEGVNKEDADFQESNKMHVINGFVFGNLKGLEMKAGERVDWYLIGLGNEVDMHTVHFHGQTFVAKTLSYHREDVYDLFPGVFATVKMIPDSVGNWLLHCHVNDHINAGMETMFKVEATPHTTHTTTTRSTASRKRTNALWALVLLCVLLLAI